MSNMYIKSALAEAISVKEDSSIMEELFTKYITTQELLNACPEELSSISGVTPKKAKQIAGVLKLARAMNTPKAEGALISSPADAYRLVKHDVAHLLHEEAWILCLNVKGRIITKIRISIGSLSAAIVHPREVYKNALLRSSASILFYHNHPSGDCTPSQEDIELSRRLKDCGSLLGVDLLDSLVITSNSYCSLSENGLI